MLSMPWPLWCPQVAKDPESGITHYICIIVAHNEGKSSVKDPDATSPVPLPKLPVNLDDVPTARQACSPFALPRCMLLAKEHQNTWT